jgi:hypothetical protein
LGKKKKKTPGVFTRSTQRDHSQRLVGLNTPEFDSPHQPFVFGRK